MRDVIRRFGATLFAVLFFASLVVALLLSLDQLSNTTTAQPDLEFLREQLNRCADDEHRQRALAIVAARDSQPNKIPSLDSLSSIAQAAPAGVILLIILAFLKEGPKVIWGCLIDLCRGKPERDASIADQVEVDVKQMKTQIGDLSAEIDSLRSQSQHDSSNVPMPSPTSAIDTSVNLLQSRLAYLKTEMEERAGTLGRSIRFLESRYTKRSRYRYSLFLALFVCFTFPLGFLAERFAVQMNWSPPPPHPLAFTQTLVAIGLTCLFSVIVYNNYHSRAAIHRWWYPLFVGFVGGGIPGWFPVLALAPAAMIATTPDAWDVPLPTLGETPLAGYLVLTRCVLLPMFAAMAAYMVYALKSKRLPVV